MNMKSYGGTYLVRASVLERSDGELEGAAGDVDVVVLDAHRVDPHLAGDEVDRVQAVLQLRDGRLVHLIVKRTLNERVHLM